MRRKDDRKLQNIKQAVLKLILEEGFQGASIAKIAREAGVSPATVYIYYENKESMLMDIYRDYHEEIYNYLVCRLNIEMNGPQIIDTLVRSYYDYIVKYSEQFYFVEQFSSCPALIKSCPFYPGSSPLGVWLDRLKQQQVIKNMDNDSITAMIFYPVKGIAVRYRSSIAEATPKLADLINMIQDALLMNSRR
jgi:AcrR family transcriptional regulator